MKNINVEQLKNAIEDNNLNCIVVDVRSHVDYKSGSIKNSLHIPLDKLEQNTHKIDKYEKIFLVCNTGNQSTNAYKKLNSLGINNVVNVVGGIQDWERNNLPLQKTSNAISINRQVQITAGSLILFGIILGTFLDSWFYLISAFVGCGLIYAGISGTCTMGMFLLKMPWNK